MTHKIGRAGRALLAATALMVAGASLGGCIVVAPRHHYGYAYY